MEIFKERYNILIEWDTVVSTAALAEITFGDTKYKNSCVYITLGIGDGDRAVINGETLSGYKHPGNGTYLPP